MQVGYVSSTLVVRVRDHGSPVSLSDTGYLRVIVHNGHTSSSSSQSWQGRRLGRHAGARPPPPPYPGRARTAAAAIAVAVAGAAAVLTVLVLLVALCRSRAQDSREPKEPCI